MDKDVFIGNITTIVKTILLATGVPALVSFANTNEFTLLLSAIIGLAWAYFDAKYSNTYFNNKTEPCIEDIDPANEYEEMLNAQYTDDDEGA